MADVVENGMEKLISMINKLQDAFSLVGYSPIDLPQIAVVGGQSSGKSSVLENVVGASFLPRGSGIVTRRPLVLQLIHLPPGEKVYGVFAERPDEKLFDYEEIRKGIEAETDKVCGSDKGLSSVPINLRIFSPHVLNLTLVDLPGTTKVAVGDQPVDIGKQIKEMVVEFVSKPNCIMLAVTAANTDLANSDALEIAREIDPAGDRTIGVLTKLDLMDHGTDAMEILEGKVVSLKMGFVGVVNRSQKDINENRSIDQARESENKFFERHYAYRRIKERCGTQYLCRRLSQILMMRIQKELPRLSSELGKLLQTTREEVAEYGEIEDTAGKRRILTSSLVGYSKILKDTVEGRVVGDAKDGVRGGARIEYFFREVFGDEMDEADELEGLTAEDISTMIHNVSGLGGGLFIPDEAFQLIISKNIRRLEQPAVNCVQNVHDELLRIIAGVTSEQLAKYPCLREKIIHVCQVFLSDLLPNCKEVVRTIISMELSRMNLNHPDFIGRGGGIQNVTKSVDEEMEQWEIAQKKREEQEAMMRKKAELAKVSAEAPGGKSVDQDEDPRDIRLAASLHKKGSGMFGNWQERYVVLDGKTSTLTWFKRIGADERGAISMKGCVVLDAVQTTGRKFSFQVSHPTAKKDFFFAAKDEKDATQWMESMRKFTGSSKNRMSVRATPIRRSTEARSSSLDAVSEDAPAVPSRHPLEGISTVVKKKKLDRKEMIEAEILRRLLQSYFNIVRKSVQDQVPKAITLLMIQKAKDDLPSELMAQLYTEDNVESLMEESREVREQRKRTVSMLKLLEEANSAMTSIRMQASVGV